MLHCFNIIFILNANHRSYLHTSREKIGDRKFYHFGLIEGLKRKIGKGFDGDVIPATIGIDGLASIYKAKLVHVWPILCRCPELKDQEPFVVSIHADDQEPASLKDFLGPFIEVSLQTNAF